MRVISIIVSVLLVATPCLAGTGEATASNYWQEFDITFWQTLPFATLFGYFIDRQLSTLMFPGSAVHWQAVLPFAVAVSAGNALINAHKKVDNK